ncbi:hypothetical protein [Gimesia panareensis]|uniref:hypothetical protein n=1 Tax=Gimesia panareensis TaxID=2527978 RepID=UPI00118BF23F|nr:hypothetical protein [Gimesia panareensis]QDU50486.1 hypothetical protein Pan110_28370 [Gimesia panareensis]
MAYPNVADFLNSKKFVILSTLAFMLGGLAITALSSREGTKSYQESESSVEFTNAVRTLGDNNYKPPKSNSSSNNELTDKEALPNDSYAFFRLIQFYFKEEDYKKVVLLAKRSSVVTGVDDVTILTIEKFLKEDVLSVSSCGLETPAEDQKIREQFLGYVIQLINTLNDTSLRASYLVNLAERQRECNNELSRNENLSWKHLRDEADDELNEIHSASWWGDIDYKNWFTLAFTACGFVISIVVKESVSGYTKIKVGEVFQKPDTPKTTS